MDTASSPVTTNIDHRGWTLAARLHRSSGSAPQGWVCYATAPGSFHKLNIGRSPDISTALDQGRAYVDRMIDAPKGLGSGKLPVQKRRT